MKRHLNFGMYMSKSFICIVHVPPPHTILTGKQMSVSGRLLRITVKQLACATDSPDARW